MGENGCASREQGDIATYARVGLSKRSWPMLCMPRVDAQGRVVSYQSTVGRLFEIRDQVAGCACALA
jgi:hypothetical protein